MWVLVTQPVRQVVSLLILNLPESASPAPGDAYSNANAPFPELQSRGTLDCSYRRAD